MVVAWNVSARARVSRRPAPRGPERRSGPIAAPGQVPSPPRSGILGAIDGPGSWRRWPERPGGMGDDAADAYPRHLPGAPGHLQLRVLPAQDRRGVGGAL